MKTKMLLVGAFAPAVGPWVFYESGEWKLESPTQGVHVDVEVEGIGEYVLNQSLMLSGPGKVRACLVNGFNVSISLTQVARA